MLTILFYTTKMLKFLQSKKVCLFFSSINEAEQITVTRNKKPLLQVT